MPDDFETTVVHAGWEPDPITGGGGPADPDELHLQAGRCRADARRVRVRPFGQPDSAARWRPPSPVLEGATHGFAYASGLAATQNILYLTEPGQRVVMCDDVYGGTWRLADKVWSRYGVKVDPVDVTDPEAVRGAVSPEAVRERGPVALVWIETPTNPLLKIADIAPRPRVARRRRADRGRQHLRDALPAATAGAWAPTSSCTRPPSTWAATRTWSVAWSPPAATTWPSGCASTRTPRARCPRHSTAGWCCAACARWRSAWSAPAPTRPPSPTGSKGDPRCGASTTPGCTTTRSASCACRRCASPAAWSASS